MLCVVHYFENLLLGNDVLYIYRVNESFAAMWHRETCLCLSIFNKCKATLHLLLKEYCEMSM